MMTTYILIVIFAIIAVILWIGISKIYNDNREMLDQIEDEIGDEWKTQN
jgi:preprotein translocase subunit SecG